MYALHCNLASSLTSGAHGFGRSNTKLNKGDPVSWLVAFCRIILLTVRPLCNEPPPERVQRRCLRSAAPLGLARQMSPRIL